MKHYVFDANAALPFLYGGGQENVVRVRRLVEAAKAGEAVLLISSINLGEVFYVLRKTISEDSARKLISILEGIVTVVSIDAKTAVEAAELKHRYKLGYADSFAAHLALERKATLVSADPSFEKLGTKMKWLRLARHSDRS